jgi:hypothetical protein
MAETDVTVWHFSNGTIKIDPSQVRGSNANSYPLLMIPMNLSFRKIDPAPGYGGGQVKSFTILSIQGLLSTESHAARIADSIPIFEPLEFTNDRNVDRRYSLEFPFDVSRLRYLEASRRGDMTLSVRFQMLAAFHEPLSIQRGDNVQHQNVTTTYGRVSQQPEIRFVVPQSQWVANILPALEIGEYYLIEIPKGKKTVSDAWKYLDKAEGAFKSWNSIEVYGNCRELGALLDRTMKDKFGANDFHYSIRWQRAYEGFKNLASWSMHLEDLKKSPKYSPDAIESNKSDAEHLLLRTKALLKYAEEILQD